MNREKKDATPKRLSLATYAVVALLAGLAGFGAVYVTFGLSGNGARVSEVKPSRATPAPAPAEEAGKGDSGGLAAHARGDMATFVAKGAPQPLPDFTFNDGETKSRTIADWKGKVVLLNLWATWCGPCRKEMPSLDRLQAALGSDDFEVVAISIDKSDPQKPHAFLKKIGVEHLNFYHDPTSRLGITLSAYGMPTTLLIDREGRELGRVVGPAEWDSQDAMALLKSAIDGDGKGPA